ncbi:MAG: hypothetical protein J2P30_28830 [Actinobacteria bacterium]|nr:hypothetical protein [Actinomycetota bacterium]
MNSDEDALVALTQRMAELGAPEPDSWASSEIREGIPQQARYLVLRRIWANTLMPWRDPGVLHRNEALARLLDRGADQELLAEALRGVVFDAVSGVIMVIDEGYDPDAPDGAPGWTLAETGSDGNATGRRVGGLHESLLDVDPNGVEAADFW